MTKPLVVEQSRTIQMGQQDVFRDMVPMPLPTLFRKWYGPIPPIKEVRNQTGDWDAVGQSRTVVLVGGGSMREEVTQSRITRWAHASSAAAAGAAEKRKTSPRAVAVSVPSRRRTRIFGPAYPAGHRRKPRRRGMLRRVRAARPHGGPGHGG